MTRALFPAVLVSAAMLTGAQAQTFGTATTDMNLRSGPDPQFPVIGMLRERQRATVIGCIEGSRWCQVDVRGRAGWAYSQYMILSGDTVAMLPQPEIEVDVSQSRVVTAPAVTYQPAPIVTYQAPAPAVTYQQSPMMTYQTAPAVTYRDAAPVVTYRAPATTTVVETTGVRTRDYSGRLIAPRETIYASANLPAGFTPSRSVQTFIATNPLDPVYLEGNLRIGAGLPVEIDVMPVPGSRYNYAYVNDYPVLVDPATRRIVYVYR